MSKISLI